MASMTLTDPIVQPSRGTVDQVYDFAVEQGAQRLPFLRDYLEESWRLSEIDGIDFSEMSAQSAHETGNWAGKGFENNTNWTELGNPAGLAITNSENKSVNYKSGTDAARAHHVHMWLYRYGPLKPGDALYQYRDLDGHYTEAATGTNTYSTNKPYAASVKTLADFQPNGQWALLLPYPAAGDRYGDRIVKKAKEIWGNDLKVEDPPVTTPSTPEEPGEQETPVPNAELLKPTFVSAPVTKERDRQGFNYGTRGPIVGLVIHETQGRGTGEWYQRFFSCPNGERCEDALVDWLIDRDGKLYEFQDPYNTNRIPWASGGTVGGAIGAAAVAKYRNTFGGVNAVFAAVEMVKTDAEALTPAQIQTAGKLLAYVMAKAGYPANDWRYPDVLGGQVYTAPHHSDLYASTTCRIGESDKNAICTICDSELTAFYAGTTPADTTNYAEAHPVTKGSRVVNNHIFFAPGGKTVQMDVYPYEWGDSGALPTGPKIVKGTKITQDQISHYVQGTDGNLWVIVTGLAGVKDGSRVPASALVADAA